MAESRMAAQKETSNSRLSGDYAKREVEWPSPDWLREKRPPMLESRLGTQKDTPSGGVSVGYAKREVAWQGFDR